MLRTLFFLLQIVMCTLSVFPQKSKKMTEKEILGNLYGKGKVEISLKKAFSIQQNAQLVCCSKINLASSHKWTCYKKEAVTLLLQFYFLYLFCKKIKNQDTFFNLISFKCDFWQGCSRQACVNGKNSRKSAKNCSQTTFLELIQSSSFPFLIFFFFNKLINSEDIDLENANFSKHYRRWGSIVFIA